MDLERAGEGGRSFTAPPSRMKQGLAEYLLVTGFLALAVAGALAVFGDDIRAALGLRPPAAPPTAAPAAPR